MTSLRTAGDQPDHLRRHAGEDAVAQDADEVILASGAWCAHKTTKLGVCVFCLIKIGKTPFLEGFKGKPKKTTYLEGSPILRNFQIGVCKPYYCGPGSRTIY